jgi:hypothetical protein
LWGGIGPLLARLTLPCRSGGVRLLRYTGRAGGRQSTWSALLLMTRLVCILV